MKIFYCDGSTRGGKNQKGADNIGGWGALCFIDEDENCLIAYDYDTENNTTNNRQELKAFIWCLNFADEYFPNEKCIIYSDSAYVVNMFNDWIHSWARNGWKNSKKQTVENLDLVQQLYEFAKLEFPNFELCRVRGHVGIAGNELADALATHDDNKFVKVLQKHNIKTREEVKFDF